MANQKIHEYPLERFTFGDDDYYDIDYWDGVTYQTAKILGSTIKAAMLSGIAISLTAPSAFTVGGSPTNGTGTLSLTAAGTANQYVRGDGTLATFPTSGGGGNSVNYYLNGGTAASVGTYFQMSKTPVLGTSVDFSLAGNGLISQWLTDINDPNVIEIPAGNWNFEMYFSASSSGGTPAFYIEILKYDGTTFTSIADNSANPEGITNGTATDLYVCAVPMPLTTLLPTDRIALRVYVVNSILGRTITHHTQDSNLSQVITTFSSGISSINGLTKQTQYLAVGTLGTDFNIDSTTDTHTFHLPTASATKRGALSSADWTTFNGKQNQLTLTTTGSGPATLISDTLNIPVASGSLTVGTTAIASGTVGRVLFEGTGNVLQQDSALAWDNTNKRLGVGATPASTVRLDVRAQGALSTDIAFRVRNSADTRNFLTVNGAGDVFNNGAGGITENTFFGENVGRSTSGQYNTFFGKESGRANTSGNQNDFFGFNAGLNNTTGFFNSFFGTNSGASNTIGQENAFFGQTSGQNSTGSYNSFFGIGSGKFTTSFYNSYFGYKAGNSNTSGEQNVFLGYNSGLGNSTSSFNTFIGTNSAIFQTSGANNTYLGHNSGRFYSGGVSLTIANNSLFLGQNTRALANNQTNQIVIGFDAIGAGSNTVTLGNTSIVKTILRGTLNAANLPTSPAGLVTGDIWNNLGILTIV